MTRAADDRASLEDLHAWQVLRPLLDAGGYLPWNTGAMRPAGLVLVCNDIMYANRTSVVECGSGASTVVLARLLRQRGAGTLTAIEHDAGWADRVRDLLRREGLDDVATVLHAPLTGEPAWYDPAALEPLPATVDLLVVDGPPAFEPADAHRRLPALAFFEPRLVDGATVILDDVDRAGERDVLATWEQTTSWRFRIEADADVAVGTR
ncbi:MAG TPA: class I SAM-dependent methyltransferase [Baekduia sp.]